MAEDLNIFSRNEVEEAIYKIYSEDKRFEAYQHIIDEKTRIFMEAICKESDVQDNKWLKSYISKDSIHAMATNILDISQRYKLYSLLDIH